MSLTTAKPNARATGYTGLHIEGYTSFQTEVLTDIDLSSGDITLTKEQVVCGRIEVTTGHASNAIIIPTGLPGKTYIVANNDASLAANIEVQGGTAVTIAATKTAIVQVNGAGTEVKRVTADA